MSIDITNLTTVAAVDSAITSAQAHIGDLEYRQTTIERQLENRGDQAELIAKLEIIGFRLDSATQSFANAPDEKKRFYWQGEITKIKEEQSKLENRTPEGTQELVAKVTEFPLLIAHYQQYVLDLQAKKATL
jgi:hypothetical protein